MCIVMISCPGGRTFAVKSNQIEQLKAVISEKTGLPAEQQTLVHRSAVIHGSSVFGATNHISLITEEITRLLTVKIGTYDVTVNVPFDSVASDLFFHLQSQFSYDITPFSVYGKGEVLRKDLPVSAIGKVELFLLPPLKQGEMQISILTLTGRNIPIIVSLEMSVDELKDCVFAVDGVPPEQQRFIFAGKQLEDGKRLADYRISNGSTVHLVLRLRGGMHHSTSTGEGESSLPEIIRKSDLVVKHPKGTAFLRVETFFSLEQVKVLLQEKLAIPSENMTLHDDVGRELENDRALGYYGIELGATLRLSVA